MNRKKTLGLDLAFFRAWFTLTDKEKRLIAAVLLVATIGVIARYVALRSEPVREYRPVGLNQTEKNTP